MAGSPSGVAGTLIIRFLRSTSCHSRFASTTVALVSRGEIGRNLDADKTVGAARRIEHRTQHVGRLLNVLDRKPFEKLAGRAVVRLQHARDGGVVFVGVGDGLLENRGVRSHPAQAVLIDELFQAAFGDEAARQKIEPHRLAMVLQRFESIHCRLFLAIIGLGNLVSAI